MAAGGNPFASQVNALKPRPGSLNWLECMGPSVAAVVVAAGRGVRAGGNLPKQYRELAGEPVIRSSLALFAWHGQIAAVQAVIHPDDRSSYDAAAKGLRLLAPVPGGATRQASVRAGLQALSARAPDIVLIHD